MKVINIVDSVAMINYGIWNTIITLAPHLEHRGAHVELWYRSTDKVPEMVSHFNSQNVLGGSHEFKSKMVVLDPNETIVVTHGLWRFPSKWGRIAQKLGFKWIMVPHGMLEPWSMNQKWFKKIPYYELIEKRRMNRADAIIAVGFPEKTHLEALFGKKVHLISNGIQPVEDCSSHKSQLPYSFLFLSRLHKKKGVVPLVKGWMSSTAFKKGAELIIAGPDDGELAAIQAQFEKTGKTPADCKITITGAVYGLQKEALFKKANFFVLPSYSEGFPTVVLEAMTYGCIPMISEGCNFPEAFAENVALPLEPTTYSISVALDKIFTLQPHQITDLSNTSKKYVDNNYSLETLSKTHFEIYSKLLE